jgi:hypothetical protein
MLFEMTDWRLLNESGSDPCRTMEACITQALNIQECATRDPDD